MSGNESAFRLALDSFERGDYEPFIALLDPQVRWDRVRTGGLGSPLIVAWPFH